jgi:thymidylate synthase (FAD)
VKIVEQSIELMEYTDEESILWKIEAACRNCYKSEGKNEEHDLAKRDALIRAAVKRGHTSVLEHASFTFRVICNRGVSHEWVRHRVGWSYSQESTRYCNYGHSEGITVIWPWYLGPIPEDTSILGRYSFTQGLEVTPTANTWYAAMSHAERAYLQLLKYGCKPEEARGVLPNDLKTEIVCTANVVALRHFFKLRCTKQAHPQIRELALQLLADLNKVVPVLFEDLAEQFLTA